MHACLTKTNVKRSIDVVLSLILLAWVFKSVEWDGLLSSAQQLSVTTTMSLLGLGLCQTMIHSLRWLRSLSILHIHYSFHETFSLQIKSNLLNHFSPSPIVGDAFKWFHFPSETNRKRLAYSLFLDRLSIPLSLILYLLPAALTAKYASIPSVLGLAIWVTLMNLLSNRLWRSALLCSVFVNLCSVGIFYLCLQTFNAQVLSLPMYFDLIVFLLSLCIPVSFNGWGLREWSAVGLFSKYGISQEHLLTASLLMGSVSLVSAVLCQVLTMSTAPRTSHASLS